MYVYAAGSPQQNAYAMSQRFGLQMGQADLPGLPVDQFSMQTYTSSRYREPEGAFRQLFRRAADFFSGFSSVAGIAAIFFPPAAAAAAATSALQPAVDMVITGMNQNPMPMMAMQTNQRYLPNFR